MILPRAAAAPHDLALDDGTRRRSWAELDDRVRRIAHWLRDELELAPGVARRGVDGQSRRGGRSWCIGAFAAGLWITPVNRHLRPEEIAHVLADSGARVVIADAEHAAAARAAGATQVVVAR